MGYSQAGFEVVGVDINHQKNYPFEFVQGDALEYLKEHGHEFDVIHASPPCQAYAITNNIWKKSDSYPDLVAPTRELLIETGKPYVIENVPGAPLISPIKLCGVMFDLHVIRHRLFESNQLLFQPQHVKHKFRASYGRTPKNGEYYTISGHFGDVEGARKAMGIPWMVRNELSQAIPPAYTKYIGEQLIRIVG